MNYHLKTAVVLTVKMPTISDCVHVSSQAVWTEGTQVVVMFRMNPRSKTGFNAVSLAVSKSIFFSWASQDSGSRQARCKVRHFGTDVPMAQCHYSAVTNAHTLCTEWSTDSSWDVPPTHAAWNFACDGYVLWGAFTLILGNITDWVQVTIEGCSTQVSRPDCVEFAPPDCSVWLSGTSQWCVCVHNAQTVDDCACYLQ